MSAIKVGITEYIELTGLHKLQFCPKKRENQPEAKDREEFPRNDMACLELELIEACLLVHSVPRQLYFLAGTSSLWRLSQRFFRLIPSSFASSVSLYSD